MLKVEYFVLSAALLLSACGGGESDSSSLNNPNTGSPTAVTPTVTTAEITAATNSLKANGVQIIKEIGERRTLQFKDSATGDIVSYHGARDAAGGLSELESVRLTKSDGSTFTSEMTTLTDRLIYNKEASVSVIQKPDGIYELTFRDNESGSVYITDSKELKLPPGTVAAQPKTNPTLQAATSIANQFPVRVTTKSCGKIKDNKGIVKVYMEDGLGAFVGDYRAARIGEGQLIAYLPDPNSEIEATIKNIKDVLASVNKAVDFACQVEQQQPFAFSSICISLSGNLASTVIGIPVAAKFLALCEGAALVTKYVCAVKSRTNLPLPDVLDPQSAEFFGKSIEGVLIDAIPTDALNFKVQAQVLGLPYNVSGPKITLPTKVLSADIEIDDRRTCLKTFSAPVVLSGPASIPQCAGRYTVTGTATFTTEEQVHRIRLSGRENIALTCYTQNTPFDLTIDLTNNGVRYSGSQRFPFTCAAPCVSGAVSLAADLTLQGGGLLEHVVGDLTVTNENQTPFISRATSRVDIPLIQ